MTRRKRINYLIFGTMLFLLGVAVGLLFYHDMGARNCIAQGSTWDDHLQTCVIHDR